MKSIGDRLAETRAELARQTEQWNEAKARLAGMGDAPLRVPVASLVAIDRVARLRPVVPSGVAV